MCALGTASVSCHNITVSQVQRPFASANPTQQHYSMDPAEAVVAEYKLEMACAEGVADALVNTIAKAVHMGQPEAGWIFLSDIQRAVEIR